MDPQGERGLRAGLDQTDQFGDDSGIVAILLDLIIVSHFASPFLVGAAAGRTRRPKIKKWLARGIDTHPI